MAYSPRPLASRFCLIRPHVVSVMHGCRISGSVLVKCSSEAVVMASIISPAVFVWSALIGSLYLAFCFAERPLTSLTC